MEQHIQILLSTKSIRYAVPSAPISVPVSSSPVELNKLLHDLLQETSLHFDGVQFVFLIDNEFLNNTIEEYLNEKQIVSESIEIEYCEKQLPPCFTDEIKQNDLISCVKRFKSYILTGSYDGTVQLWTVENPKPIFSLELEDKVKCLDWLNFDPLDRHEATFVTGGFDQTARLWVWNMKTNAVHCAAICRGHSETVMTLAARPGNELSGTFASGSWDGTIKLWSSTPECTDLSEETGGIAHTRKSADKIPTRIPRLTLAGHRETVTAVHWLPTSTDDDEQSSTGKSEGTQLISGSWDHTLRVWDCQTVGNLKNTSGQELRSIVASHAIHDVDASLQGILTASSDNRVRIYDLRSREALASVGFHGHTAWLTAVAWAPHRENQFITGSIDRSVRLWDTRNIKASLYNLMGHTDMVTDVDWAPAVEVETDTKSSSDAVESRHFILSSSADGTVKIYRIPE